MASSFSSNISYGTTRSPSCSSGDTQPETGSVPLEKPPRVFGGPPLSSPSTQPPKGIFVPLLPLMQVSPSNPYAEREFSMELYKRVSAHVAYMQEHPYEKTLEYKVSRVRTVCRGYLARFRVKVSRRLRVFLASASRHIRKHWGYFTAFLGAVGYRCRVALQRVSLGCVKQVLL